MLLSDKTIIELAEQGMITPFHAESVRVDADGNKITSYGLSSYGYDIRLAPEFKLYTQTGADCPIIDIKNYDEELLCETIKSDYIVIPPGGFILARTVETFNMPDDVLAICLGKSTYARAGCIVNVTPLEPGWSGQLVVELTNGTSHPLKIYANEGIAQLLFLRGDQPCITSYRDRSGKYDNQEGIVLPRM